MEKISENDTTLLQEKNPELYKIYNDTILLKRTNTLKRKTKLQFQEMKTLFKSKKYKSFKKFVDTLLVIRNDSSWAENFKAPIHTWIQSHWGKELDQMVKAENYVYASFDNISHYMASNYKDELKQLSEETLKNRNIHFIDDSEIKEKSEIIFCDIANISQAINYWEEKMWVLEGYMKNCFDYEWWKKILALYLSIVFDTPEQAKIFLKKHKHPKEVQLWYSDIEDLRKPYNPVTQDWQKDVNNEIESNNRVIQNMKEIFIKTWILPPLSLEVRIQDEANKINVTDLINKQKETVLSKIFNILFTKDLN